MSGADGLSGPASLSQDRRLAPLYRVSTPEHSFLETNNGDRELGYQPPIAGIVFEGFVLVYRWDERVPVGWEAENCDYVIVWCH